MKQYFRLLALVLIFCTGCGAQQASTTNLTDTASPSAIVSGAAVTPEAVTATGPAALPQNTVNPLYQQAKPIQKMVMRILFLPQKIMYILPMEKAFFRHLS